MTIPLRTLGKTGLKVSALGFGCMRLPILDGDAGKIDIPLATAMLRKAIDAGVNYVDTAWPYHGTNFPEPGNSEPFVAQALRDGYRDKVILATKLPVWKVQSREDMDKVLDEQLKRLDVSYLDVYLIHNLNSNHWAKMRDLGVFSFLDSAVKDGRIRHPGFSFHDNLSLFKEILGAYDWEIAQIQYNYLDTSYQAGTEGLGMAAEQGKGVVVMEPLRGGFLIRGIPGVMRAVLRECRPDWSLAEWALRWVFSESRIGTVLSGMSAMEHVEENLRIAGTSGSSSDFGPAEREALGKVRDWFSGHMAVSCTACGYCLPCPKGVAIPDVFTYLNEYHLDDTDVQHSRGKGMYRGSLRPDQRAEMCVGCRGCESRCPQGIPIAEKMKEAVETFA